MTTPLTVGVLDSGVDPNVVGENTVTRSFLVDDRGDVVFRDDGAEDALGHGTALATIIFAAEPSVRLAFARIFIESFACTPAAAAAGIDWLVDQGTAVINMSIGLRQDRAVLRESCDRAIAAGVVLLASAPARGPAVFPGSYDGVVRVSGDARCAPGEISVLGGEQADFGAHPRPKPWNQGLGRLVGGASFAVAHVAAAVTCFLTDNPEADRTAILKHLDEIARYRGPERRSAGAPAQKERRPCNH